MIYYCEIWLKMSFIFRRFSKAGIKYDNRMGRVGRRIWKCMERGNAKISEVSSELLDEIKLIVKEGHDINDVWVKLVEFLGGLNGEDVSREGYVRMPECEKALETLKEKEQDWEDFL